MARLENWERIVVFGISIAVPFGAVWYLVPGDVAATVRALASLGGSMIAVVFIFVWSMLKLPGIMEAEQEAEHAKLAAKIQTEDDRKRNAETFGRLIQSGEHLIARLGGNESLEEPELLQWGEKCADFLAETYGNAYKVRFYSDTGMPSMHYSGLNVRQGNMMNWLHRRVNRLHTLMGELI